MRKMILVITILAISLFLLAEEELRHGLGFTGGMISGSGFSYRQMNETYGFQFAFGAITLGDNDDPNYAEDGFWGEDTLDTYTMEDEGIFYYTNFGASYYKFLHRGEKSLFYVLTGVAIYTDFGTVEEQVYGYDEDYWVAIGEPTEESEVNLRTNIGIGIGIDYKLTENIHLNLDWPLVFSKCEDDFDIIMYIPQAGIHYYFK